MRVVALQCAHLDQRRLLQESDADVFTWEVRHVLNNTRDGIDEVDHIVALLVHNIDVGASLTETLSQAALDDVAHELGVRLIANLEHVVLIDLIETSGTGL